MQPSSWIGVAMIGLFAAVGVTWVLTRPAVPKWKGVTFRDVCGSEDACWAVRSTGSALSSLATAADGRCAVFNNESPPRGSYSDGLDVEMVRAPAGNAVQNHTMGAAHECFVERCEAPLRACSSSPACRGAWTELVVKLGSVMEVALFRVKDIAREDVRELATCFLSRCLCIADLATGERAAGTTPGDGASSHVARFEHAIDDDDAHAVLALAAAIGENASFVEQRHFGAVPREQASPLVGHQVTYLQSRFTTDPLTARLYERLRDMVIRADEQRGWRRVHAPTLVPRTIELLKYASDAQASEASLSLGWHVDEQSVLTALVLLSDPADFAGGQLYHLAAGKKHAAHARQHELLVYRSHTPHAVGALMAGSRLAVALEFWHVHAPGEGVENPAYPYRRVPLNPRAGASAPSVTTLGRCPR
jgi:hypothetical protein